MCQSHMEAPVVAGTTAGTETRDEIGALLSGGCWRTQRMVLVLHLVLGMGLWLVLLALLATVLDVQLVLHVAEDRFIAVVRERDECGKVLIPGGGRI